jgi:hypothetical protein
VQSRQQTNAEPSSTMSKMEEEVLPVD